MALNRELALRDAMNGLIAQGKCSGDGNTCLYRGPDNTKCAVGFLIPDDQYDAYMDEVSLPANDKYFTDRLDHKYGYIDRGKDDHVFLIMMQRGLHDRWSMLEFDPQNIRESAEQLVDQFGLDANKVFTDQG